MPFQSEKQRRYLHANHPEIAKRWEREYSNGTGSEGVLGIGEKNWLVDEEGNPIMLKEQPPEKNWTIDEEGNPIILEEPPREKHWIDAEEITTDDGNDIELTAFNAEFDDPNDLSTGVKTLFQAKNGGMTIQGGVDNWLGEQETVSGIPIKWKSQPGAPETELAYITKAEKDLILKKDLHGSLKDGPNIGPNGVMSLDSAGGSYGSPGSGTGRDSPEGVGYAGHKDPVAPPGVRQQQIKDMIEKQEEEKYDTDLVGMSDSDKYAARRNMIKEKYTSTSKKRSRALTTNYNTEKARLEKKLQRSLLWVLGPAVLLGAPVTIKDFVGIDWKNKKLSGPLKTAMTLDQLKKQQIADLTVEKESLLADVDINNPNEMKNLDDTAFPDVMKELKDLTKPKDEDDTKGDGPEVPQVVPVHEEIEEYEGTYAMSPWERIKANQQKRAMLVEKGIIQEDNPIVGESVTDITMQANKGGLANLFRVKNQ